MAEPSEHTPLLSKDLDTATERPASARKPNGSIAAASSAAKRRDSQTATSDGGNDCAGDGDGNGSNLERQTSIDEARVRQFEGNQEAKAKLKYIIPAVGVGVLLASIDTSMVVAAYAAIGSDLKELNKTSWIASAYFLTLTSFQPLYGKLSDIFGRKPVLLFAYSIFGLGCLWCGLATSMDSLIIARAFTGIGGGGMTTVTSILMSDIVPLQERGMWQGVINLIWATGAGLGAPLGGLCADTIGWRLAFIVQAPISLVAITSAYFTLNLPHQDSSHWSAKLRRIDFAGALCLVSSVTLLLVGLDRGSNVAWDDTVTIATLAACVPLVAAFVYNEAYWAAEPFAPGHVIFSRSMLAAYLCNFFSFCGIYSTIFYLPLYFQGVEAASATRAGVLLIPSTVLSVVGSLGGGLVLRATGRYKKLTVAAYGLTVVGSIATVICLGPPPLRTDIGVIVSLVVTSLGNGTGVTTTLIALISNADPADQAIATACSYLFRSLGSVLGLAVTSTMLQQQLRVKLANRLGNGSDNIDELVLRIRESLDYIRTLPPDVERVVRSTYGESIRVCFVVIAAFMVLTFASSVFIREKRLNK